MFVHSVYFWLKPGLGERQVAAFRGGLESLAKAPTVTALYVGTPAATDRPIIDRSYSFALTVVFHDKAAHDAYQTDPVHLAFVDQFGSCWDRVLIYDAD